MYSLVLTYWLLTTFVSWLQSKSFFLPLRKGTRLDLGGQKFRDTVKHTLSISGIYGLKDSRELEGDSNTQI